VSLIEKLHKDSIIEVGSSSVIAEMGLPQGSVLSPVLFNVYLEEALGSSELLKKVRSRGDLLAFADDMLIMSNEREEIERTIHELACLHMSFNLCLNKKKSEILTADRVEEIAGIRCVKTVKYLGVRIKVDIKEQRRVAKE
jgi:RNA-directed DNA polymerase